MVREESSSKELVCSIGRRMQFYILFQFSFMLLVPDMKNVLDLVQDSVFYIHRLGRFI